MPKYLITLPPQPLDQVKAAWASVVNASGGSGLTMDNAYVDKSKAQAICCWDAPDQASIEDLFSRVGVATESIQEVEEYTPEVA